MNEAELARVVDEWQGLVGAHARGAWQPSRDRLVLGVGDALLLLVPRGSAARAHRVRSRPKNPPQPYSFQGALRAHLVGPLTAVNKYAHDRVVDLVFGENVLHLRLTGRSGGLWLVRDGQVAASLDGPSAVLPDLRSGGIGTAIPRFHPAADETWNDAAARHFQTVEDERRLHDRRVSAERTLRALLARDQRLLAALQRDLAKADQVGVATARAEAFAASVFRVPAGSSTFEAEDLSGSGEVHRYTLDPRRSPGSYLNELFGRVKRLERMADRVLQQMEAVELRIARTGRILHALDGADPLALAAVEKLLPPAVVPESAAAQPWWTWTGPSGQVVLCGKNGVGNRQLTFQIARAADTWMHARDIHGPHVIIRGTKGHSPSLETLIAAAQIALMGTRVGNGDYADVQYTKANLVKAVRGGGDGRVVVHEERVLRVQRDDGPLRGWVLAGRAAAYEGGEVPTVTKKARE